MLQIEVVPTTHISTTTSRSSSGTMSRFCVVFMSPGRVAAGRGGGDGRGKGCVSLGLEQGPVGGGAVEEHVRLAHRGDPVQGKGREVKYIHTYTIYTVH